MVIVRNIEDFKKIDKSVLTIGSFDGMHKGHTKLIRSVVKEARIHNLLSVAITFDPHPKNVLGNKQHDVLISLDKKNKLFNDYGIDIVWVIPFTYKFSKINADFFLKNYIIDKFNPYKIVIGNNHHFGNKKNGDSDFLIKNEFKYLYKTSIVKSLKIDNISISTTLIKSLICQNKIDTANKYLGWDYEINGKVVSGNGLGKRINFPTANIKLDIFNQHIPGDGSYCVEVEVVNKLYKGMCNIGRRPTFYKDGLRIIEVHIITDDTLKLLNEKIKIIFKSFIRNEFKFDHTSDLIKQLEIDRQYCLLN